MMLSAIELERVKKDIMDECQDDFVGLWSVIRRVKDSVLSQDRNELRRETLRLVETCLRDERMVAGTFNREQEFVVWEQSPARVIVRIDQEWRDLNREPNIGEVVWFTLGSV